MFTFLLEIKMVSKCFQLKFDDRNVEMNIKMCMNHFEGKNFLFFNSNLSFIRRIVTTTRNFS